jgi:hypothetical protein
VAGFSAVRARRKIDCPRAKSLRRCTATLLAQAVGNCGCHLIGKGAAIGSGWPAGGVCSRWRAR